MPGKYTTTELYSPTPINYLLTNNVLGTKDGKQEKLSDWEQVHDKGTERETNLKDSEVSQPIWGRPPYMLKSCFVAFFHN
jgi:hypothetical protein